MKQILAILAAAGLMLVACDKQENQQKPAAGSTPTTATPAPANPAPEAAPKTPDPAPPAADPAQSAADAPAPAAADPVEAPRMPAVDVEKDPRRKTAVGTLEMFVVTMREADYETALELLDPSSDGYAQIQEAFNAMQSAKGKGDGGVSLEDLYKTLFTRAWQNATLEKVGEQEGHVKYVISFQHADPVSVDLRDATGSWLIVAPGTIFALEQVEETPAAPAETPPPPPADGGH